MFAPRAHFALLPVAGFLLRGERMAARAFFADLAGHCFGRQDLLAGAAAARAGADREAVERRVREARAALKIWFCLDTLEYLRRGGRIGKAQAWLGGTLKIKPILSLEYEIVPVERVRTAGRAFERMVAYAQELHASGSDGWVVQHIQAPEQAEHLIARCREVFDSEPVFASEVGPVIGTYTGPGLLGVGAVPRSLLA